MTNLPVSGDGIDVGEQAVAWLACERDAAASGSSAACLAGLGREQCLAVATALLASTVGRGEADVPQAMLAERLAVVGGRVSAVAAWLASVPPQILAGTSGVVLPTSGQDEAPLVSRLAAAIVVPGDDRSPTPAGRAVLAAEAIVLREAALAARSHAVLRDQFDRAVADARLEAMRELAYGAGHEINNPLANIATRAQSLLLEEHDPERRRRLSTIVDQSFRARDMIGGLMLFARPPKPRPEVVDVGCVITAVIEAIRGPAVQRGIRLEYSPPPRPLSVCIDRVQVEEALRVVVVNALEAVAGDGRVVLHATRRCMDGEDFCEISVVDDGRGMSFDVARRAFDPFFSGREAGRGAGLGLPKAWRLLTLNGGRVELESRPSQGTRLTILLPEAVADVSHTTTEGA